MYDSITTIIKIALRVMLCFFASVAFLLFILVWWQLLQESPYRGNFEIVNRADETIARMDVSICHQDFNFRAVESGQSVKGVHVIKHGCEYNIKVRFVSGKKMESNVAYMTRGMNVDSLIAVKHSGAEVIRSKSKGVKECGLIDMHHVMNCFQEKEEDSLEF